MELYDAITVTKVEVENIGECYLMVGWQKDDSFEVYLYKKNKLWKGRFSPNRLLGFSKSLHVSKVAYFNNVKTCLAKGRGNYRYEMESGFFYWQRKVDDSFILEGFLPMDLVTSPQNTYLDLTEILLTLNNHLKEKVNTLKYNFQTLKTNYEQCLQDTEEFLGLKIDMEKALCDRFLKLLDSNNINVATLQHTQVLGQNKE